MEKNGKYKFITNDSSTKYYENKEFSWKINKWAQKIIKESVACYSKKSSGYSRRIIFLFKC